MEKKKSTIKSSSESIYFIDDEETITKLAKTVLSNYGYNVHTFNDGKSAVAAFTENADIIDLVILDVNMPVMSGKDVYKKLITINPETKIVISSGEGETIDNKGMFDKASAIIHKPFKIKELTEVVRTVFDA